MGQKNYRLILDEIEKLMENGSELPPLFTWKDDIPMIKSLMHQFCTFTDTDTDTGRYRVYPLQQLFLEIINKTMQNSNAKTQSFRLIHAEQYLNHVVCLKDSACNVSFFFFNFEIISFCFQDARLLSVKTFEPIF